LWRLIAGRARHHPLAPFLASALTGFLVVGASDSLLDAPRAAFSFYVLLLASLALRAPAAGVGANPVSAPNRAPSHAQDREPRNEDPQTRPIQSRLATAKTFDQRP